MGFKAISDEEFYLLKEVLGVDPPSHEVEAEIARAFDIATGLHSRCGYSKVGKLKPFFLELVAEKGELHSEFVARSLLAVFLRDSNWKPVCQVPDIVKQEFAREKIRIRTELFSVSAGHYRPLSDAFYKDFALLRGAAMPGFTGIVDTHTILWRRPLIFGPFIQRVKFLDILLTWPFGTRYFFQHHVHSSLLERFNESGRLRMYRLVVALLEANENHKGFCGTSWFYDPQLKKISPRLSYLADYPLAYGARRFHLGQDLTGSAVARSATRARLHEQGRYVPQSYMLVWPKKPMVRHVESYLSNDGAP